MTSLVLDSDQESGDEVDVAVREVNKLLGEVGKERRGEREEGEGEGEETESSPVPHSLLKVDRRYSTYTWGLCYQWLAQCVMGKRRNYKFCVYQLVGLLCSCKSQRQKTTITPRTTPEIRAALGGIQTPCSLDRALCG